jgi:carbon monoxide dehydrogenase subunit G
MRLGHGRGRKGVSLGVKLDGRIEIAAPVQAVWHLVIDPVSLASCVPGVRDVRQIDERTFEGSISAAVGPIEGDFTFTSVLTRANFPDDLEVQVQGLDSVTKSRLEVEAHIAVVEVGPTSTTLTYHATVKVKGRLAILGEMILRATASLMIGQVTKCLRSRLELQAATDGAGGAAR